MVRNVAPVLQGLGDSCRGTRRHRGHSLTAGLLCTLLLACASGLTPTVAPSAAGCSPGSSHACACGHYGMGSQVCDSSGTAYGDCICETACTPGTTVSCSCDDGGTGTETCLADGGIGVCSGCTSTTCSPNATQSCTCAGGGSGTETCDSSGSSWGTCAGCESCTPGATQSCTCGSGTAGTQTCDSTGASWGACADCDACTPSATQPCTCASGTPGTQTCDSAGDSWGTCSDCDVCTPDATQSCTCAGGTSGTQTCDSSGAEWGSCTDCATCSPACDPDATCKSSGAGDLTCVCDSGWVGDGTVCGEPTAQFGGSGGTAQWDTCPAGQVVVGYNVWVNASPNVVAGLQAICDTLTISPGTPPSAIYSSGATLTGEIGSASQTSTSTMATMMCPENEVVVGFTGRAGAYNDAIALNCATLVFTATGNGYAVSHANEATLPQQGGSGGSPIPSTDCASDSVVIGTNLNFGAWIDVVGFLCAPVSVP